MEEQSDRRDKKAFEPPPWEADRFEQLKREREQRDAEERASQGAPEEEVPAQGGSSAERPVSPESPMVPVAVAQQEAGSAPEVQGETESKPALPDGFEAMLVQLSVEEPTVTSSVWRLGVAGAAVLAVIGFPLSIWGVFGLVKAGQLEAGQAAALGGAVMLTFGLGFIAAGVFMAVRSLRQGGVL
jgi:hypothetical protein